MPHADLLDVFNAGTRAASPFVQAETNRLREQNDLALKNNATRFALDFENYARDNPYQGNYDEYLAKLNEFTDEWYGQAASQNTSAYFQRNILQMQELSRIQVNDLARREDDAWRMEQAGVDHTTALTRIKNSNLNIAASLEAMMIEHENYSNQVGLTPAARAEELSAMYNQLFDKALSVDVENLTVNEALAQIDGNTAELYRAVREREGPDATLDDWLENKDAKIDEARSAARISIWRRNYHALDTLDSEYRRIAGDAVRTGDYGLIREAMRLWNEGSQLREAAMESSEYDPGNRSGIAAMFPLFAGLRETPSSGGSSGVKLDDELEARRDYHLNNVLEGRGTLEEERQAFMTWAGGLAARTAGVGDIDTLEQMYPNETAFFKMWTDAEKLLRENGYGDAYNRIDVLIQGWKNSTNDPTEKALRQWQGDQIGLWLFDKLLDTSGAERLSPDEVTREGMNLATQLIAGKISFMKTTTDNSMEFTVGSNADQDFGKAVYEIGQHPEGRFIIQGQTYTFGDPQYMAGFENRARSNFETITGISLDHLSIGHSKEGQNDEAAELNIIVSGSGNNNGTYRFSANESGEYWIERQTEAGWVKMPEYKMASAAAAARRSETNNAIYNLQQEQYAEQYQTDTAKLFRQLWRYQNPNEHEYEREEIANQLRQRNAWDEAWKLGIDLNTGLKATSIPAATWDSILRNMPANAKRTQEQTWQRMGITRSGR